MTTNEYHLRNNQLKKVSGSLTYPVEYTYDPQGRMKTLTTWQNATTSAGAAVTTWNYDSQRGWLTEKRYDNATGPAYTYTDAGRLDTRTWVRTVSSAALVTTYGYNNAGDLVSTDYSDSTPDVAIVYDRIGRQETLTDATGTRTFTYNTTTLRPNQEQLDGTYFGSRILTRTYETSGASIGRSTGFQVGITGTLDQDYAVTYGYDTASRLSTVTDKNGGYTYAYTANSNLRATLTGPVHEATTTYEAHRDVIDILENKVGMTSISKYDYTVNSLGQRTARANTGTAFGTTSTDDFSYNAKGEVTGTSNATIPAYDRIFAYDDIGNRTSATDNIGTTSYTANTLNAYTAIGAASPTHDSDGNQTATGTGQIYTWDGENRLVTIEPALPLTSDLKQVNTYDAQSRRVRKQVYTYSGSAWSLTSDEKFIYDGWNVVAVLNAASSNALLRTYTWGLDLSGSMQGAGGVSGLLSAKDGSSVYHYTYDANGNVSEVLNSSGGIAAHYEYDAFGNTVASSGTYVSSNAYRFSTKPLDGINGLYYYGFRYYNPNTGRWLSRDPIGERGGFNLYMIITNNLICYLDYLGLKNPQVTYNPPDPVNVPTRLAEDGESSGTKYSDRKIVADCSNPCSMKITVSFSASIVISKGQAKALNTTPPRVQGHEQGHIQSRIQRVKTYVVEEIEKEEVTCSDVDSCNKEGARIRAKYFQILFKQTNNRMSQDHKGDEGSTSFSPEKGVGQDPLPGTPPLDGPEWK